MVIETALSMTTIVSLRHCVADNLRARLAYVEAMLNTLYALLHQLHLDQSSLNMSVTEFSL
jgi:hypothetical protein